MKRSTVVHTPTATRNKLDDAGRFLFGKHRGKSYYDVDRSYVQWVIDNVEDISDEDRRILMTYMFYESPS